MEALSLFDADLAPNTALAASPASMPGTAERPRPRPTGPRIPVLLAVDGNSLAHRAFHAYPMHEALRGFCALLAAVADRAGPEATVVGFDCTEGSARRERWAGYKAQRPPKDVTLRVLIRSAEALLGELGVAVLRPEGWEADDVLASAAHTAETAGWRCVLATSDRDAYAQISDNTLVLRLRSGMDAAVEVTRERLRAEVGVDPEQYVEFAALRGDSSDNLDGVAGIGPARAAGLLRAYRTVAEAAADPIGCRSVLGRPAGQALLDDLADPPTSRFLRNVDLMTARRDLAVPLDGCRRHVAPERIEELLAMRGLGGVAARMATAFGARPEWPPPW